MKYKKKFSTQSMKMKILKWTDWNYKENAENFQNSTRIELIDEKQYYQTYEDVFGETAAEDKNMFHDYGQQYHRQSLRQFSLFVFPDLILLQTGFVTCASRNIVHCMF